MAGAGGSWNATWSGAPSSPAAPMLRRRPTKPLSSTLEGRCSMRTGLALTCVPLGGGGGGGWVLGGWVGGGGGECAIKRGAVPRLAGGRVRRRSRAAGRDRARALRAGGRLERDRRGYAIGQRIGLNRGNP